MKINKLIKDLTKEYIPLTKFVNESKKNGTEVTKTIADKFFKLHTTLEFYKIIKGMFMEEVTKNKKMTQDLIKKEREISEFLLYEVVLPDVVNFLTIPIY